ncbi:helix-turn-helix domain-containing protein [Pseudooceanicola sp. LIPI14-2-Ac024]|uniref:helix-turn-helix domain-containing protein n=1 Tax=Pseudooceanicola sp. LIPI14-2-Ac024 TaxID=3344875 RepID=UPI0035D1006F
MKAPAPSRADRFSATVHSIRSPLSETSFGLQPDAACLLVLEAGEAVCRDAAGEAPIAAPRVVWLAGRQGVLRVAPGSRGALLVLSQATLSRVLPPSAFGQEMHRMLRADLSVAAEGERQAIAAQLADLQQETRGGAPAADMVAEHLLSVVLIRLWRAARAGRVRPDVAARGVAQGFVQLAGLHLRDHWQVADYAAALGVSRDRLSAAVRRATGRAPQVWLHEALHREATELLSHSSLQVAQVAFRLGFSDPAYFNRFFKRMEGVPPSRYRRRTRPRAAEAPSFAAWP